MTAPNASRLIHLLIEERARYIGLLRACLHGNGAATTDADRDQATREIEAEVLYRRNPRTDGAIQHKEKP